MALYEDEPWVEVPTPDGRILRVPRNVALQFGNNLPQNEIPQANPMPAPMQEPQIPANSVVEQTPPETFASQGLPVPSSAMQTPVQPAPVPVVDQAGAFQNPVEDAAVQQQVQQPQPAPKPVKKAVPIKLTPEQEAAKLVQDRYTEEARRKIEVANQEAEQQTALGHATAANQAKIDAAMQKQADDANKAVMETQRLTADFEKTRKEIANQKIDRSVDHPMLSMIGVVLSGMGSAMKGEGDKNPALDMLFKVIDRKVAGQMQDLELKGKILGYTKDQIDMVRNTATDRNAINKLLTAAETDKAKSEIERITALTNSPILKARGMEAAGALGVLAADAQSKAVQAQIENRQKQQDINTRAFTASETKRHDLADEVERNRSALVGEDIARGKIIADAVKTTEQIRVTQGAEALKTYEKKREDVSQRGIKNLTTKDFFFTAKGKEMNAEAERLEKIAASATPEQKAQAQPYLDKAAELRDRARVEEAVKHRDPTQAGVFNKEYGAAQQVNDQINDIINIYNDTGRSYASTDEKRAIIQSKVKQLLLTVKTAEGLGVLSKTDVNLLETEGIKDPTSGWTGGNIAGMAGLKLGIDPDAWKGALKSIGQSARDKIEYQVTQLPGFDPKDKSKLFILQDDKTDLTKANESLQGQTPGERAQEIENRGPLQKAGHAAADIKSGVGRAISSAVTGEEYKDTTQAAVADAEARESVKYTGFDQKQEPALDTLMTALRSDDPDTKAKAIKYAANQAASSSVTRGTAMLNVLDQFAPPDVFEAVKQNLPPNSPAALRLKEESPASVVLKSQMLPDLAFAAVVDNDAFNELAKRSVTDPAARQAMKQVQDERRRAK